MPSRVLVLGWNRRGASIVEGLNNYLAAGSEVTIAGPEAFLEGVADFAARKRRNIVVTHRSCDPCDRKALDALEVSGYDHVITLSFSEAMDPQRADAATLVTLLHLRDIASKNGNPEGSEIYLKPASRYVKAGVPVNFYTVIESAKRFGETAIGYRLVADRDDHEKGFGVKTNPKKSASLVFSADDKIIVLAEEA